MVANGASPVAVIEGEVTFKMTVSADMAPSFQVVAYAVLPSQGVIAHSIDFNTETCFSHRVSVFDNGDVTPRGGPGVKGLCSHVCVPGVSGVFR